MSRTIPIELVGHMAQPATTLCALLKVTPVRPNVDTFGVTSLDRDVPYDDGTGALIYRAPRGYTPSDQIAANNLSVDNGEAKALMAEYALDGVTLEGIGRGDYDGARFIQYLVNYEDTTQGHTIINSGQIGEIRSADELTVSIELRSLTQILKQTSILELTSITCRADFGDARCKMPLEWSDFTVMTVGAESDRVFTIDALPDGFILPGVIQWFTGNNAGREYEIEEVNSDSNGDSVTLLIPTNAAILPGDTGQIRRDCDKSRAMCISYGNIVNMRGEPDLPRGSGMDQTSPTPPASA